VLAYAVMRHLPGHSRQPSQAWRIWAPAGGALPCSCLEFHLTFTRAAKLAKFGWCQCLRWSMLEHVSLKHCRIYTTGSDNVTYSVFVIAVDKILAG